MLQMLSVDVIPRSIPLSFLAAAPPAPEVGDLGLRCCFAVCFPGAPLVVTPPWGRVALQQCPTLGWGALRTRDEAPPGCWQQVMAAASHLSACHIQGCCQLHPQQPSPPQK